MFCLHCYQTRFFFTFKRRFQIVSKKLLLLNDKMESGKKTYRFSTLLSIKKNGEMFITKAH